MASLVHGQVDGIMRELGLGAAGADVRRWERFLVRERALDAAPSGFFGSPVATATQTFQRSCGAEVTGRADASTLEHALRRGLLDRELDDVPEAPSSAPARASPWSEMGPIMVAGIAAVTTIFTNIAAEYVKHHNALQAEEQRQTASIKAEHQRFRTTLIQQALQVQTATGAAAWRDNEAQWEVLSRLKGYVSLGLIDMDPDVLISFEANIARVPVTRTAAAVAAPPQRAQHVFIRFAGSIVRDEMVSLARALSADWQVQGAASRTGGAAGLREVRWGHAGDEEAAKALAQAVWRTGTVSGVVAVRQAPDVPANTLQVWISR